MRKFLNLFIVSFIALLFIACAQPTTSEPSQGKKAFDEEDLYILYALEASNTHHYNAATALFRYLYTRSNKYEYKKEALRQQLLAKDYSSLAQNTMHAENRFEKEMHVIALLHLKAYDEAVSFACSFDEDVHDIDYLLCFEPLYQLQSYNDAQAVLLQGYKKTHSDKIAKRYAQLLYNQLNNQSGAIAFLQTHIDMLGGSKESLQLLISFYADKKQLKPMLNAYIKLYALSPESKYSEEVVKLAIYLKENDRLINFLEESHSNDALLLDLYIDQQAYDKASTLAYALYERLGDIDFLGKSAIFYYESTPEKKADKQMLGEVVYRLKEVVAKEPSALYLNYLGYLLIDHDINVTQGMRYVQEALKSEPDSIFYLDSLAWGYYKQHKCKKAMALIDKVKSTLKKEDSEVQQHYEKIQTCMEQGAL